MEEWHDTDYGIVDRIYDEGYIIIGAPGMMTYKDVIKCPDFFNDHFLGFLDSSRENGTAVHLVSRMKPGTILDGRIEKGIMERGVPSFYPHRVKPINEVYENPDDVNVLHIFHKQMNLSKNNPLFSEKGIEDVLGARGFRNVRHMQLYEDSSYDDIILRDVMLDTKGGCVYVFPKEERRYLRIPFF